MKVEFTKEWLRDNKIAIQCNNKNEADAICKIFGTVKNGYGYSDLFSCFGVDTSGDNYAFYSHNSAIAFYRETIIQASEVIAQYEATKRNIIGYKAPFDIFGGHIKKDDIFKNDPESNGWYIAKYGFQLPAEIVEQWEPVYEEVKPCFGSFDDLICYLVKKGEKFGSIKFGDETIDKSKYDFTPEFEQKLKEMGINT